MRGFVADDETKAELQNGISQRWADVIVRAGSEVQDCGDTVNPSIDVVVAENAGEQPGILAEGPGPSSPQGAVEKPQQSSGRGRADRSASVLT